MSQNIPEQFGQHRMDKIMVIAEELSQTRAKVELTLVNLRTQLVNLRDAIDKSLAELRSKGVDATLNDVVGIEEKSTAISRNIKDVKQQSMSLEQALGYIRSANKL